MSENKQNHENNEYHILVVKHFYHKMGTLTTCTFQAYYLLSDLQIAKAR